jgi:hypothetical protein
MKRCLWLVFAAAAPAQSTPHEFAARLDSVLSTMGLAGPSPATVGVLRPDSGARFLRDLQLELKTFESRDDEPALGFGYAYEKAVDLKYFREGTTTSGFGLQFAARGSVAFDEDTNPQDFLESRLSVRWFQNQGGVTRTGEAKRAGETDLMAERRAWLERFDAVVQRQASLEPGQEAEMEGANRELEAFAADLTTQVYLDVALDAGFETDQRFDARNAVIGVRGILDVKAWNKDSVTTWANLLDYPFATLRYLLGSDESFQPRGGSLPQLLLGADWVEPQGDDPRTLVGERDGFCRLRGELGFRTPLGTVGERTLHLSCNYRIFHEVGAEAAVRAAELQTYDYASVAIVANGGLFVSYRTGRLPFDLGDDEAFEVGFKTYF